MSVKDRKIESGLVSIVVPVYNAGQFIGETIRHVQSQTYRKWELLLVDDCSTDNSRELISEQTGKTGGFVLSHRKKTAALRGRGTAV